MPRRKYNAVQAANLELVETIHVERMEQRAKLRREIAKAFEDRMTDLELKESRAMNVALASGVAKTDLGRAIGTSNFETIKAMLARTAGDLTAEDLYVDPLSSRYALDPDAEPWPLLTVTLDGDVLEHELVKREWKDRRLVAELELSKAVFEVLRNEDGSLGLMALTPVAYEEHNWNLHPVVAWINNSRENSAEALAWCTQRIDQAN